MSNASIIPPNRDLNGWLKYFPFEVRTWRQIIADSDLPDEAQNLVREVVRKSRLMRFEKTQVVQELIGHFLDGQMAGESYSQMLASFGDPKLTATLIRRSKIRNRPVMLKIAQIVGWIFLGIFSVYLGIYAYFHAATPSPHNDYLADLNILNTSAADNDKAWPIYRKAWNEFDFGEHGQFNKTEMEVFFVDEADDDQGYSSRRLITAKDLTWPEATAKLKEIEPLLEAFRIGANKSRLGFELQTDTGEYSEEDHLALFSTTKNDAQSNEKQGAESDVYRTSSSGSLFGILIPHIQQFRQAARLLQVDTRWAVEQNDSERATRNIEAFMGLGSHASDSNILVGSLVGFAIANMGFDTLEEVLEANPRFFDDDQLDRLVRRVSDLSFIEMTRVEGERASILDIIQRVYSDDGNGNGRITPEGVTVAMSFISDFNHMLLQETGDNGGGRLVQFAKSAIAPASMFVVANRKDTTELAHEYIDSHKRALRQPLWARESNDLDEYLQQNSVKHFILASLLPAIDAVTNATDRMSGRQEGVLAALAAHRYYLSNQHWPERLVDTAPEFIAELPTDVVTGNELLVTTDVHGLIVYSVGWDQDDDGGLQTINERGEMVPSRNWVGGDSRKSGDGDWIVWPQSRFDKRGIPKTE